MLQCFNRDDGVEMAFWEGQGRSGHAGNDKFFLILNRGAKTIQILLLDINAMHFIERLPENDSECSIATTHIQHPARW